MDITNRKIFMFRCHIDPMIGPKPRLAYVPSDMGAHAEIAHDQTGPVGVYIKLIDGIEHLIPFPNVQSIRLAPEDKPIAVEKRGPGRWPKPVSDTAS